ncbi:MAG TPA: hypothetical protein VFA39_02725 [Steroidobacteraceae bacterium]|nr:hypothetical protein [Steroidobacteraceae bacterium]
MARFNCIRMLVFASVFAFSANVALAAAAVQGQIGLLEFVGGGAGAPGNFDFRIFLIGNPVICAGQTWTYINGTEANYNTLVAATLSAKASGGAVTLHVDPDTQGFCHIEYMDLQ